MTKSGKPVRVASHRRQRMQSRVAKAKRKGAGVRKDFSHKVSAFLAQNFEHVVLEDLNVKGLRRSARGTREQPGRNVKAKSGLNRKLSHLSCMGQRSNGFFTASRPMWSRCPRGTPAGGARTAGTPKRATESAQAHFRCRACGHTGQRDANAARNILDLGLNRFWAGGAPVTGRGEDNEAGAFFMEGLVETAYDPPIMQWKVFLSWCTL